MHEQLQDAVNTLNEGGIIAYPTEAVFGLGCDPNNEATLSTLINLKARSADKGIIIIASDYLQLLPFIDSRDQAQNEKLQAHTSTPTTWIVDANASLPTVLTGGRATIAVRITQHPLAAALCRLFGGAITSTSANISGQNPACDAESVRAQFADNIDLIIDAPTGTLDKPTRIIDARTDEILR